MGEWEEMLSTAMAEHKLVVALFAFLVLVLVDRMMLPRRARVTTVRSPIRTYEVLINLGTGDLCDVFSACADGRPYVLKMPCVGDCDSLLDKEQAVLKQLHEQSDSYSAYFPRPVEMFRVGDRHCSVFDMESEYVLASEMLERYPHGLDGRHIAWIFNRMLEALGFVHKCGWIHGAVLPPHLLFDPESHGLRLIGWTHVERLHARLHVVPRRFKSWYPPECYRREAATRATDIYLAAKSVVWLAGGDPLASTMPTHVPVELRSFVERCLADSPAERPQDAWKLHEEFKELLETLYGPPGFCHVDMS